MLRNAFLGRNRVMSREGRNWSMRPERRVPRRMKGMPSRRTLRKA
jgi:hypothetical protein